MPDQSPEVMRALAVKATKHISSLHGAEHRLKAARVPHSRCPLPNAAAGAAAGAHYGARARLGAKRVCHLFWLSCFGSREGPLFNYIFNINSYT